MMTVEEPRAVFIITTKCGNITFYAKNDTIFCGSCDFPKWTHPLGEGLVSGMSDHAAWHVPVERP